METSALISASTGAAATSKAKLATDFDQFLLLLTAQLQNQDPLDPLNSNEFVQQLVSFTGVEQAIATNANLESLIAMNRAAQAASAVSYLGTTVEATGNRVALANGEARFLYTLPENASSTSILIADESGDTVFVGKGNITAGEHGFVWDGRDANGVPQPDGIYKITVSGFSSDDILLSIPTVIGGRVTLVETVDGGILLTVNGIAVPIEEILSVAESPPLIQ
jgi:flagellar basal-body rod modification protein FlgD